MKIIAQIISALLLGAGIIGTLTYGLVAADTLTGGERPSVLVTLRLAISLVMLILAFYISRTVRQSKPSNKSSVSSNSNFHVTVTQSDHF